MIILKIFAYAIGFAVGLFLGGVIVFGVWAFIKVAFLPTPKPIIDEWEDEDSMGVQYDPTQDSWN